MAVSRSFPFSRQLTVRNSRPASTRTSWLQRAWSMRCSAFAPPRRGRRRGTRQCLSRAFPPARQRCPAGRGRCRGSFPPISTAPRRVGGSTRSRPTGPSRDTATPTILSSRCPARRARGSSRRGCAGRCRHHSAAAGVFRTATLPSPQLHRTPLATTPLGCFRSTPRQRPSRKSPSLPRPPPGLRRKSDGYNWADVSLDGCNDFRWDISRDRIDKGASAGSALKRLKLKLRNLIVVKSPSKAPAFPGMKDRAASFDW
mmetsp:Transcript_15523/g.39026  ORF Transcript_15523/g.39026 Transcript_15523/m.39026 type:complete len:257 (+) Transcript_15523:1182-1952(+)